MPKHIYLASFSLLILWMPSKVYNAFMKLFGVFCLSDVLKCFAQLDSPHRAVGALLKLQVFHFERVDFLPLWAAASYCSAWSAGGKMELSLCESGWANWLEALRSFIFAVSYLALVSLHFESWDYFPFQISDTINAYTLLMLFFLHSLFLKKLQIIAVRRFAVKS